MALTADRSRVTVRDLVAGISPHDEREAADQARTLDWIDSGAPLFRTAKPATPPQHLVMYAALVDEAHRRILLVDHINAGLFLLPGGHADPDEDPRDGIIREVTEELGLTPPFHPAFGDAPLFLTVTWTRPPGTHQDVTLWFCFSANSLAPLTPDTREFRSVEWLPIDNPTVWAEDGFDPEMARFISKLTTRSRPSPHHG
ncbi:NUDIX hydrolase [Planomonospora sphaerica]|uniref:NUDIX hydrolase n=1 Tax=Planomonospora sphaerica TaxID=161355 RepID=A0A171DJ13_9ACTN|nr:NUDIX domain-containing protein [Planomonospora sphaerica]GAT68852.1 NUDIX hydrolase [Planomonospora sphaerica]